MTPNIAKDGSGLEDSTDGSVSIIEWLETKIHPWSVFVIVPLFAFANTGVEISRDSIRAALDSPIAWGILDRKSTRLNSSHEWISRMPSSA